MLFGFTPDETEVSESCGSEVMGKTKTPKRSDKKCWRCSLAKHQEDVRCVPYGSLSSTGSLSGEVEAVIERTGWQVEQRKLLVRRCSVGLSTSSCPSLVEVNTEKRLATDCRLFTSIRIRTTRHNRLRARSRDAEAWRSGRELQEERNRIKAHKRENKSVYHQWGRLSELPAHCGLWEMNGLSCVDLCLQAANMSYPHKDAHPYLLTCTCKYPFSR